MVSSAFLANSKSEGGPINQREGQIITEYLAVLVESRIKCETTHTSPDILTEIMASHLEPRLTKNMRKSQPKTSLKQYNSSKPYGCHDNTA